MGIPAVSRDLQMSISSFLRPQNKRQAFVNVQLFSNIYITTDVVRLIM
jgi:hypothetical protein